MLHWRDLIHGTRTLRRSPGFAALAILTLGLGIGANTAAFTVIDAVLFSPLNVTEPEKLVRIGLTRNVESGDLSTTSFPEFLDIRNSGIFKEVAAESAIAVAWNSGPTSEVLNGSIVSGNYFDVLGVEPALGRLFEPDDDQAGAPRPVAVISNDLWRIRHHGSTDVMGTAMRLNGQEFTIVGVAPPGFSGSDLLDDPVSIWVPMAMQPVVRPPRGGFRPGDDRDLLTKRNSRWLWPVARLYDGQAAEAADGALIALAQNLAGAFPRLNQNVTLRTSPFDAVRQQDRRLLEPVAGMIMGVVAIVLLLVCVNVSNLMIARSTARQREIATRLALGASRRQLVAQLLIESSVLSVAGLVVGALLATWSLGALRSTELVATFLPSLPPFELQVRVFLFTAGTASIATLLVGLAPAVAASRTDVMGVIKGVRTHGRPGSILARHVLVATQVALSFVLLTGAALFARSLSATLDIDTGFDHAQLLIAPLDVQLLAPPTATRVIETYERAAVRAAEVPGVVSTALARVVPLGGTGGRRGIVVREGRDFEREQISAGFNVVTPGYFRTLGIGLRSGRDFLDSDGPAKTAIAIINEELAQRFWPGDNAVGKRLRTNAEGPWIEVVGVVNSAKYNSLFESAQPFVYLPFSQNFETGMTLVARTSSNPESLIDTVRAALRSTDPDLPVQQIEMMQSLVGAMALPLLTGVALLSALAGVAMLLACSGVYGVARHVAASRTRETGIRIALGATSGAVAREIAWTGMISAIAGIAAGVGGAAAIARLIEAWLVGTRFNDPPTYAMAIAIMLATVAIASWVPARRAARIEPWRAIRD